MGEIPGAMRLKKYGTVLQYEVKLLDDEGLVNGVCPDGIGRKMTAGKKTMKATMIEAHNETLQAITDIGYGDEGTQEEWLDHDD